MQGETNLNEFDFLRESVDDELLRASAQNILDSYAHPWDILAETLQNGVDAVEQKAEQESNCPKAISIVFDCKTRSVEISDTGIGITAEQLKQILTPHKSLKKNLSKVRGQKGVGI